MTEMRKMFTQSSHYFYAQVLGMAAHLISFPILTRLLPVSEYGYLGLLTVTIFIIVAVCKSGMQNSFVRFYNEFKKTGQLDQYYSTFFYGPLPICLGIVLVYLLNVSVVLKNHIAQPLRGLLIFIAAIIFFRAVRILFMSFWRAEQRTKIYNGYAVMAMYLKILLGLGFFYFFKRNIFGFLTGYLISDACAFVLIIVLLLKDYGVHIRMRSFSGDLFRKSLLYGLPLLGMEFTNFMLSSGDRYIIAYLMDARSLGLYSAAANLSQSVSSSITFPLSFAIVPIYMKLWAKEGEEKTQQFLSQVLRYSCLLALPVIFGLVSISRDLLVFLASSKYIAGYTVIPFLVTGTILFGLNNIFNAGILIKKKTIILMFITIGAGLLNVVLNFVLISRIGILGAAVATLISYAVFILATVYFSFKYLRFRIDFVSIGRYLAYSVIMFGILHTIDCGQSLMNVIVRTLTGVLIYALFVFVFEKDMRDKAVLQIKKIFSRGKEAA